MNSRLRMGLDRDWLFHQEDVMNAQQAEFDDASWRVVQVPHDWSIEGEYRQEHPTGPRGGYTSVGVGWYRKTLDVPEGWLNRKVVIEFDGIYMNSDVWINGHHLGHRPNGYIGFEYDLTPWLHAGVNTIAVRVDTSKAPSARWYTGSGIYRHVWLTVKDCVHIDYWGTYVTTPEVSAKAARIRLRTKIINETGQDRAVSLVAIIKDSAGDQVATTTSDAIVTSGGGLELETSCTVSQPKLWSPQEPNLYTLELQLKLDGCVIDQESQSLGIRSFRFDADEGFSLNGQSMKFQGVCLHYDAGPVGYAVPDQVLERRLRLLKAMGCNAIRTAHHPMAPEFYDLCDRLGFMVMNEAFDGWDHPKAEHDYGVYFHEWWRRDLTDTLLRDRNHPCIILWSIGNEVEGIRTELTQALLDVVHELDPSRPVTCGLDDITEEREANRRLLDIAGYNDGRGACFIYERDHQSDPDRVMIGTETPHTFQTRGFYRTQTWWRDKDKPRKEVANLTEEEIFFDGALQYNSSYDNSGVRLCARDAWSLTRSLPYLVGEFRWTGFDYLGESFGWPARMGNFGIIDLCGFPKDHYYFYQSQWTSTPMVHILPHWTHPGMEGVTIPVWVYTNCETVELFLNGKSLGVQAVEGQMNLSWDVPYTPGSLGAIGRRGNSTVTTSRVTAAEPARIRLEADRTDLVNDGVDVSHVQFEVKDNAGVMVPYADDAIRFHVRGPIRCIGMDNGDPLDLTPHGEMERRVFNGKGLGLFQSTLEEGTIEVIAAGILGRRWFEEAALVTITWSELSLRGELADKEMVIYYSTDGSEPHEGSNRYVGPIAIVDSCTIRAALYDRGRKLMAISSVFHKGKQEKVVDRTHGNR